MIVFLLCVVELLKLCCFTELSSIVERDEFEPEPLQNLNGKVPTKFDSFIVIDSYENLNKLQIAMR